MGFQWRHPWYWRVRLWHFKDMGVIDFYYEFASTYSYPAAMRIDALAEQAGYEVRWRPFLLGPIFKDQGWSDSPFNLYPVKGCYMWTDLQRICTHYGFDFQKPSTFPRRSLLTARIALTLSRSEWVRSFSKSVFIANFVHDLDIAEPAVVSKLLNDVVGDLEHTQSLLKRAQSDEIKLALRKQTEAAQLWGIFGAPSFIVNNELYWGNDRLEMALGLG